MSGHSSGNAFFMSKSNPGACEDLMQIQVAKVVTNLANIGAGAWKRHCAGLSVIIEWGFLPK